MSTINPPHQTYRELYQLTLEQLLLTHVALSECSIAKAEAFREAYEGGAGARDRINKCNQSFKQANITAGLFVTTTHGKIQPTSAGAAFLERFTDLRLQMDAFFTCVYDRGSKTVRIAATEFTMGIVCRSYPDWHDALGDVVIDLVPVRTNELADAVQTGRADIGLGACIGDEMLRPLNLHPELEFAPIGPTGEMGILTNTQHSESIPCLTTLQESLDFLADKTLLLPRAGLVLDYVNTLLSIFPTVPRSITITDVYFGLSILSNGVKKDACMFLLRGVYEKTKAMLEVDSKTHKLTFINLPQNAFSRKFLIGIMRRRGSDKLGASHPVNIIWKKRKTLL